MDDQESTLEPMTLRVGDAIQERRIDKYLHGRFSNYSRVMIQNIIRAGAVTVNGKPVRPSFRLSPNDTIDLTLPELPSREILPEDIPLDILHEDDDIIVVNKQADLIVHPARGYTHGTLVNALAHHCEQLSEGSDPARPGIVHRLDRNTTGVIVVAKNDTAQWKIATQFEYRKVEKQYLAVVHGTPELHGDRINAPLGVHPRIRERYSVRPETGKEAVTIYEVLEPFRGFSLIVLRPQTGRTHQIRVHMSYIKHPIVADDMYGGKRVYPWQLADAEAVPEEPVIKRCALHAWKLKFTHPSTEQPVEFEAPMPADMQHLLDLLRQYRRN